MKKSVQINKTPNDENTKNRITKNITKARQNEK